MVSATGKILREPDADRDLMWENRMASWARRRFTLETGLLAGGALVLAGVATDAVLLWQWIYGDGSMEGSVHAVFVATTAIAVGLQLVFFAFLLHLALIED